MADLVSEKMSEMDYQLWAIITGAAFVMIVMNWGLTSAVCRSTSQLDARRDHLVGIRIRSTMASDEAWRAGHQAVFETSQLMGRVLIPCSALGMFLLSWRADVTAVVEMALLVVCFGWMIVVIVTANQAAKKSWSQI